MRSMALVFTICVASLDLHQSRTNILGTLDVSSALFID
jgi:hypothetical protein